MAKDGMKKDADDRRCFSIRGLAAVGGRACTRGVAARRLRYFFLPLPLRAA